MNYLDCELDGFGGLKFLEKTGQCVYSPDIKGYFMDHCRSEAGVYVDPLIIAGKKKDYLHIRFNHLTKYIVCIL